MNSEDIYNPIEIRLRTACNLLYNLGLKYHDVKKDVFINRYEKSNIVQDYKNFLKIIKEQELYFDKFNEDK